MDNLQNKVEVDILLKMYYNEYEPENCNIRKIEDSYYIGGVNINRTTIFEFKYAQFGRLITVDDSIEATEEYEYLESMDLTKIEKLILVSYMLGNDLMKDSIPSKVRSKLTLTDGVEIKEPEDITMTI